MSDITDDMIACWRANYGLDSRTPEDAMRFWLGHNGCGMAPAGAVAALGIALNELDRLRERCEFLDSQWKVALVSLRHQQGAVAGWLKANGPGGWINDMREQIATLTAERDSARDAARQEAAERMRAQERKHVACWCASCDRIANGIATRMSVCPECGSKRCARAEYHDQTCDAARKDQP